MDGLIVLQLPRGWKGCNWVNIIKIKKKERKGKTGVVELSIPIYLCTPQGGEYQTALHHTQKPAMQNTSITK